MTKFKHIPDGELFADLQVSMTDLVLMEILGDSSDKFAERIETEKLIQKTIREEIKNRFTRAQIITFLIDGFPRRVNYDKSKTT